MSSTTVSGMILMFGLVSGSGWVSGFLGLDDEGVGEGDGSASICSVVYWVRGTKQIGSWFKGEGVGSL